MIAPQPSLDPTPAPGKISSMIRRLIHSAIRSSMQEVIEPSLIELKSAINRLEAGQVRLELRQDRLDAKLDSSINRLDAKLDSSIDRLDQKLDATARDLGTRLNHIGSRLDQFGVQQQHLIKEVAALQREHETTRDINNRLGRIEDRLLKVESGKS